LTIPSTAPSGTYYLLSCADDLNAVTETNEANNCRPSTTTVQLVRPDLVVTAVTNPPATIAPGGTFRVTDTVANQGTVAAGVSTARYYLSADQQKDASDVLLGGSRSVSSLGAGQTSSGNTTVTIPSTMPSGTYYLLSCANDLGAVTETNEGNNCRASTATVQVTRPDLVVTAVSNPPATAVRGGTFKVTDTVANQGIVGAGASTTRYYLSTDQQQDATDVLLTGSRSVSSLNAGQASSGNKSVTIPSTTLPGTYYLLACADGANAVTEIDETNNCRASTSTVVVK
jgi:subtilase family serine protease